MDGQEGVALAKDSKPMLPSWGIQAAAQAKIVPATLSNVFGDLVPPSPEEIERPLLEKLSNLFTETKVNSKNHWCHEGQEANTLGIVLVGQLAVQNESDEDPTHYYHPGDIIGERELCGHRVRNDSMHALEPEPCVIAEIEYDEFIRFIEGLGLKRAKSICQIIAVSLLEHVKREKVRQEELDRQKLQSIGNSRRGAFCNTITSVLSSNNLKKESSFYAISHASTHSESYDGVIDGLIERCTVPIAKELNREIIHDYNNTLQDVFERNLIFVTMEEKLAKQIRKCFHTVQVKAGDILMATGDNCEAFFVVHTGEIGVYVENEFSKAFSLHGNHSLASGAVQKTQVHPNIARHTGSLSDKRPHELASTEEDLPYDFTSEQTALAFSLSKRNKIRQPSIPTPISASPVVKFSVLEKRTQAKPEKWPVIQFTQMLLPTVKCFDSSGAIQVRRKKLNHNSAEKVKSEHYKTVALAQIVARGAAFGNNALVSGDPSDLTLCALCDSTLLVIGRERFAELRLQYDQKRFYTLKRLLERTPYACHLSAEAVCNLVDAVTLRNYSDGDVIVSNDDVMNEECFTVLTGCVAQVKPGNTPMPTVGKTTSLTAFEDKTSLNSFEDVVSAAIPSILRQSSITRAASNVRTHAGMKILKQFNEGDTFAEYALEDLKFDLDVSKVSISPTFMAVGKTTCFSISRTNYNALIGRFSPFAAEKAEKIEASGQSDNAFKDGSDPKVPTKKKVHRHSHVADSKEAQGSPVSISKVEVGANVRSEVEKAPRKKIVVPSPAAPTKARLRGALGNTGPLAAAAAAAAAAAVSAVDNSMKPFVNEVTGDKRTKKPAPLPKKLKHANKDASSDRKPVVQVQQEKGGLNPSKRGILLRDKVHSSPKKVSPVIEFVSFEDYDDDDFYTEMDEDGIFTSSQSDPSSANSVPSLANIHENGCGIETATSSEKEQGESHLFHTSSHDAEWEGTFVRDQEREMEVGTEGVIADVMRDLLAAVILLHGSIWQAHQVVNEGKEVKIDTQDKDGINEGDGWGISELAHVSETRSKAYNLAEDGEDDCLENAVGKQEETERDRAEREADFLFALNTKHNSQSIYSSKSNSARETSTTASSRSGTKSRWSDCLKRDFLPEYSRTHTPLVKTETPTGAIIHAGTSLLLQNDKTEFQSASGSRGATAPPVGAIATSISLARSSTSMTHSSSHDSVLHVSFDEIGKGCYVNPTMNVLRIDSDHCDQDDECEMDVLSDKGYKDRPVFVSEEEEQTSEFYTEEKDATRKQLPAVGPKNSAATKQLTGAKPKVSLSPGPGDYNLPHARIHGGRTSNSDIPSSLDMLQRIAAEKPSPGEHTCNKFSSPKFAADTDGIRIDLSDRNTISGMREIIKKAQETPGPNAYVADIDSILARQRRIVDKQFAIISRQELKRRREEKNVQRSKSVEYDKSAEFRTKKEASTIKDAIRRFTQQLDSEPSKELVEPHMLSPEVLYYSAAQRIYRDVYGYNSVVEQERRQREKDRQRKAEERERERERMEEQKKEEQEKIEKQREREKEQENEKEESERERQRKEKERQREVRERLRRAVQQTQKERRLAGRSLSDDEGDSPLASSPLAE